MEQKLKNPKKADLDKDGQLSGYEKKRGMAIEKAMNASEGKFSSKPDVLDYMKKKGVKSMPIDEAVKKTQPPEFLGKQKNAPTKSNKTSKIKKITKQLVRDKVGVFTTKGRLLTAAEKGLKNLTTLPKNIAGKTLGAVSVLIPKQLGSAELKDIERKKYGGPVGVKMAKGGFKKKTPIY